MGIDLTVWLPILGEVDVDAIYRNPNVRLYRKRKCGLKPIYDTGAMKRCLVALPPLLEEKARALGNGNLSAGIRAALEKA